MKMDKLKKDDIQLEKVVSELKERLKYKDELNLDLIQRNRELKAKLRLQLSLKSELTEKELLLTVGLESLLLLKKHRYNHIKKEEDWLLLYDAINILYGDISLYSFFLWPNLSRGEGLLSYLYRNHHL